MAKPQRVSIHANLNKSEAVPVARRILARLKEEGVEVLLRPELAARLDNQEDGHGVFEDSDLILCLGGDGTLLNAARSLEGRDIPILGVNLGGLGFLTAVPSAEIDSCLDAVIAGAYQIENRRLLKAVVTDRGKEHLVLHALNDIVLDEGTFSRRAVVLRMTIDGEYIGTFTADGLVVATPTGSTAYSLSAGGPIVQPDVPALVVTPICAHSLSIRPLVFSNDEKVDVENLLPEVTLKITADGQDAHPLAPGMRIRVEQSERSVRLAFLGRRHYYEILRTKLNWGGIPKDR